MNMKKLIFVAVLSVFAVAQVFAAGIVVNPRSVRLIAKENQSAKTTLKVITPSGYEKKIRIENIPDWLKVEPVEFLVNRSNQQQEIRLTASTNGLKLGDYNANLTIRNVTENDKPDFAILAVVLSVVKGEIELSATPRSIEIRQGVTRTISVSNPTGDDITAKITSSSFWIQTYPEQIDIPSHGSALIWAKMTEKYLPGGSYTSTIDCASPIGKLQIPVKTVVESGLEFNPDTISASGSVTITNKLKRPVIVKPSAVNGVTFDQKKLDISEGKSKIIKITFTSDKKPDYIKFTIMGGLKQDHNLKVSK